MDTEDNVMNNENASGLKKTVDPYWQFVRGICIIFVILIHGKDGLKFENALAGSWNFDYWLVLRQVINFPVAVFFFLAGYFSNVEETKQKNPRHILKRLERLILPFYIWSLIYTLVNIVSKREKMNIGKTVIDFLFGLSASPLYYVFVLVQLVLLTPILIKLINRNRGIFILYLITPAYLVFIYIYTIAFDGQPYLYRLPFLPWFLFFFIGIRIKIRGYKPIFKTRQLTYSIVFCIICLVISILEGYGLVLAGYPSGFASGQIKGSTFLFALSIINLLMVIKPRFETHKDKLLIKLGDHSYGIYYVHLIWIMLFEWITSFYPALDNILPLFQLVQFLFTITMSMISILIVQKILGKKSARKYLGF